VYFALGQDDIVIIAEAPDISAVAASGVVRTESIPLLTPEEVDKAVKQNISYRPPGR
jgi:uncharacterized protein with GYD domain